MCKCKIHEKVIVFVNNDDLVFFAVNKAERHEELI